VTELVWVRQARDGLLDIYVTVGRDNPDGAERIYDAIEARVISLARYPCLGRRRPDIRVGARLLVQRPYLILYRTDPDADDAPVDVVTIVRVIDGRRDLPTVLADYEC
jgi:toxin ParE1/3/4